MHEMRSALLLDSDSDQPVLASAVFATQMLLRLTSTCQAHCMMEVLTEGDFCLSCTCVKHKPPHPEFSKRMKVHVWMGDRFEEQVREGGTQKVDGFFRCFPESGWQTPFQHCGKLQRERPPHGRPHALAGPSFPV